ncbi:hypothetical protein FQA39_LY08918 [Lamprigera yunnana]|nr:hypothetical protein FQA39_LY08918 [Lamprigera yunnana]
MQISIKALLRFLKYFCWDAFYFSAFLKRASKNLIKKNLSLFSATLSYVPILLFIFEFLFALLSKISLLNQLINKYRSAQATLKEGTVDNVRKNDNLKSPQKKKRQRYLRLKVKKLRYARYKRRKLKRVPKHVILSTIYDEDWSDVMPLFQQTQSNCSSSCYSPIHLLSLKLKLSLLLLEVQKQRLITMRYLIDV